VGEGRPERRIGRRERITLSEPEGDVVAHPGYLAAGVPIRVDAAILDDPVVDSHPEWAEYPARLADLAAEERQRRADFQVRLAQEHEGLERP
jgi:hypothetical protein